jgi:membrane-bound lytic murein transglycosylase D
MLGRCLGSLVVVLCLVARASAQDEPVGEDDDAPPTLETDDEGRRAVRGSPVEPVDVDPQEEAQRVWEEKTFQGRQALAGAKPEEVRPDLDWLKGIQTGDMPVRWDDRVIRYLEFYKDDPRGRSLMTTWLTSQGRYKDMILAALRRHKLPEDLLYLCMIESAYDPTDYSRSGASGLWQFMPAGGRIYGLEQTYWVDERNDPIKSTEAVMLYWRDLYDRFGNWHMTLAAFNAGYGAVLKSIAKYNTNDFWALLELEGGLPFESSIYVPKALAAAIVGHNRALFGYDGIVAAQPFDFDAVTVPKSVTFATIAKAAGVDPTEIAALNPELLRGRTPAGVADYEVRIPKGRKERFAKAFPQARAEWDVLEDYTMRHGERFEDVAKTHGLTPRKLRELNGVVDIADVRGGTVIVVPHLDADRLAENARSAEDDLYKSEVTPGEGNEPMLVPVPDKDFMVPDRKRIFYRVVAGDTLPEIAAQLGVKTAKLAEWNGIDADTFLQPRMVIVGWVPPDYDPAAHNVKLLDETRLMVVTTGSAEHLDIVEGRKGRVRKLVKVKKGDTFEKLGKPHGLSKYDVARINRKSYNDDLAEGDELVLYVIVDKAKAKKMGVKDTTWKNHPKKRGGGKAKAVAKAKGGKDKGKVKGKPKAEPKARKGKDKVG